jgi:hypothetical protein
MRYSGVAGQGHGAIYIGKQRLVGGDVTGARYEGTYTSQGAVLVGSATLTSAGATLVTGLPVPPGTKVQIAFSLPASFANGQFQTVSVGGKPVQVAFDKIGDIP